MDDFEFIEFGFSKMTKYNIIEHYIIFCVVRTIIIILVNIVHKKTI